MPKPKIKYRSKGISEIEIRPPPQRSQQGTEKFFGIFKLGSKNSQAITDIREKPDVSGQSEKQPASKNVKQIVTLEKRYGTSLMDMLKHIHL